MFLIRDKIHQGSPVFTKEMEDAAVDALRNDRYLYGENVLKFEEEFSRFVGTKHAVSTSSGTAALAFILISIGAEGKKWVTSPMSFIASSNCIIHAGGIPAFADISLKDYCIDPDAAEKAVRKNKAAGIIPVHIYGQPVDFDKFAEIASEHNVKIIEDACQAHGAKYKGRKIGSLGDAAAFSFYPSKNMTVLGDGGMVTTDNEEIADICRKLRDSGRISKYEHDLIGYTARMSSVNAAIGRVQLRHIGNWNNKRRSIARIYNERLKHVDGLGLPQMPDKNFEPVFHQFVITTERRDELKAYLDDHGIETGIHYPIPIHLQPVYRNRFGFKEGDFKNSEVFSKSCLSLPMHVFLEDEQVRFICETVEGFFDRR